MLNKEKQIMAKLSKNKQQELEEAQEKLKETKEIHRIAEEAYDTMSHKQVEMLNHVKQSWDERIVELFGDAQNSTYDQIQANHFKLKKTQIKSAMLKWETDKRKCIADVSFFYSTCLYCMGEHLKIKTLLHIAWKSQREKVKSTARSR